MVAWYVDDSRAAVVFDDAVLDGIAQYDLHRIELVGGYPIARLWRDQGQSVSSDELAAAVAEQSTDPVPQTPQLGGVPDVTAPPGGYTISLNADGTMTVST